MRADDPDLVVEAQAAEAAALANGAVPLPPSTTHIVPPKQTLSSAVSAVLHADGAPAAIVGVLNRHCDAAKPEAQLMHSVEVRTLQPRRARRAKGM